MTSSSEHLIKRQLALGLAKVQIVKVLGGIIKPEGTAENVDFDKINHLHCKEVNNKWRTSIARQGITLNWHKKIIKRREKIDVSIHCNGFLCGLMLAQYSRNKINVNLRLLEGCPYPKENPLLGNLIPIALIVAEQFALAYAALQVTISNPEKGLISRYRQYGYELIPKDRDRERRNCPIRGKLLIKNT
ncbi:hypothetical protein [Rouxiella sp. Mn2063]|uniref:hypothetical protein n=1 Tax=Rouxiella sp. Mn2063 TaxID=3395262 RepID=UPI003BDE15B5